MESVAHSIAEFTVHSGTNLEVGIHGVQEAVESGLPIKDLCAVWVDLKAAKENLEAMVKAVNGLLTEVSGIRIPEALEAAGLDKVQIPELERSFYPVIKYSASMKDKGAAFRWLREHDAGSLITETVNANTLASFLKDHMVETGEVAPDDVFSFGSYTRTGSSKYRPKTGA